jgi:hypothetical protein
MHVDGLLGPCLHLWVQQHLQLRRQHQSLNQHLNQHQSRHLVRADSCCLLLQ